MTYLNPFDDPDLPEPMRVARMRWHGWRGSCELQGSGNRLFFRMNARSKTVFAVSSPLPAQLSRDEWPAFWRAALEQDEVARLTWTSTTSLGGELWRYAVLWGERRAWVREWWSDDWQASGKLGGDTPIWTKRGWSKTSFDEQWCVEVLRLAPLPTQVRENTALRWSCGDEESWRRVVSARLKMLGTSLNMRSVEFRAPFFPQTGSDTYALLRGKGWPELLRREFAAKGLNWTRDKDTSADLRGGWHLQNALFVERLSPLEFLSTHEQLEAALFLREWLRDRAAPDEIEGLLS